jgi:hypothetical protein
MKKSEEKRIPELAEFDDTISLWQMIPAGSGKGLMLLKKIVDYIINTRPSRCPSIIITGQQGIRTHAHAFLRALGLEDVREMDGFLLQPCSSLIEYFRAPSANTGYVITGAHQLDPQVQVKMIDILNRRKFNMFNFIKESKETYCVEGTLILTAPSLYVVSESIRRTADYHVAIEPYTHQQKILLVLQRLKYCGLEYDSEEVLVEVVLRGNGNLREIIQLMQVCMMLLRADGRTVLEMQDVKKAADLLPPTIQSKS